MPFKALLETWSDKREPALTDERYAIQLTLDDAARLAALAEMFPGNSAEQIVTDLLSEALNHLEASMPYVAGDNVIREDEFGDPIYEDVGMTPRFLELVKAHRRRLQDH